MSASVTGNTLPNPRADGLRTVLARLESRMLRLRARYLAWRRFHGTRSALLRLDERTLQDVTGLRHDQIQAMTGSRADRRLLGLN
ncbi:MAG: hypothetical protein R3225_06670 [Halofilum sp. (in: g-proteobacteria)]|nr:hypothetical protein [Halofilum sp. (in: g-proteobacteria)]